MAKQRLTDSSLSTLLEIAPKLAGLIQDQSATPMWFDYDREADVLYVHFTDEPESKHSEQGENGIIYDYHDDQLVGVTVLDASEGRNRQEVLASPK